MQGLMVGSQGAVAIIPKPNLKQEVYPLEIPAFELDNIYLTSTQSSLGESH
jgi:hypothetical protein